MAVFKKDISNNGAKPTPLERLNLARDLQWSKAEKAHDFSNE